MMRHRLPLFGRLDRYVTSHFASSYSVALLLVVGLFWILDMASNLDEFLEPWEDGETVGSMVLVRYYVLNLPFLFLQVAPFVTLVAGMFTVNRLLKKNEIVAALGAGISAHRLLLPVFLGGILAALGMVVMREWVGERVASRRDALLDVLENKRHEPVYENLWVRDLSGSFVRLSEFVPGDDGRPAEARGFAAVLRTSNAVVHISATRAVWDGSRWQLEGGVRSIVGDEKLVESVDVLEGFEFTPELVMTYRRAGANPLELSFSEIQDLMRRDPDSVIYQTLWQYHLTFPLANIVLLLIGIPVMIAYERGRGTDRMALGGVLCLFYFGADFVCRTIGLEGGLSPVLASWLPVLAFGSLGIVLYDSIRT